MDPDSLRSLFDERGYVRLADAFPAAAAASVADAIWEDLHRRHGVRRNDRRTWTVTEPRGLGGLRAAGVFAPLGTPAVAEAITCLVGSDRWPQPADWGAALVTFPRPGSWAVPATGWHIDWPARGAPGSQLLVKLLGHVTPVERGGGATVVLAGSHRLVSDYLAQADPGDPGRSRTVRDAIFGSHPWFRDLQRAGSPGSGARLMDEGAEVRGVPVKVVELTGRPGDAFVLHPHLLHAAAPNRGLSPRFMVGGQVVRLGP
jgi:hypothetical protein